MVNNGIRFLVIFDAHLHGVNFIQQTDGFYTLLRQMDLARVEKCVIFGLPVSKPWPEWENEEPKYYLSDEGRCYYYLFTDAIIAQSYMGLTADNPRCLSVFQIQRWYGHTVASHFG